MLGGRRAAIVTVVAIIVAVLAYIAYYELTHGSLITGTRPLIPKTLRTLIEGVNASILVKSSFSNFSTIPREYTCDGKDISIPLTISGIPLSASCLALIMYDPDAPKGTFYHWIVYNITVKEPYVDLPPGMLKSPRIRGMVQGINSFGFVGYGGPCPPKGSKHRYVILVIALRKCPEVSLPLTVNKFVKACREGGVLAYGVLVGIYGR